MKTIEILVSPSGQTTVQTKGFSGASCQEASRFLETALGSRLSEERTAEFYQGASETEPVRETAQEKA